jgi:hypothetical protein
MNWCSSNAHSLIYYIVSPRVEEEAEVLRKRPAPRPLQVQAKLLTLHQDGTL